MVAELDPDYIALIKERDDMIHKLIVVEAELDKAFLASVKFETPSVHKREIDANLKRKPMRMGWTRSSGPGFGLMNFVRRNDIVSSPFGRGLFSLSRLIGTFRL